MHINRSVPQSIKKYRSARPIACQANFSRVLGTTQENRDTVCSHNFILGCFIDMSKMLQLAGSGSKLLIFNNRTQVSGRTSGNFWNSGISYGWVS